MRSLSGRRQAGAPRRRSRGWPAGARGALRRSRGRQGSLDRRPGSRGGGRVRRARVPAGCPPREAPAPAARAREGNPAGISHDTRASRPRRPRISRQPHRDIRPSGPGPPPRAGTRPRAPAQVGRAGATALEGRRGRRGDDGGDGGTERGLDLASDLRRTFAVPIVADDRPCRKGGSAIAGASGRPLSRGPSLRRQPFRSPPSPKRRRRPRACATRRGRARDAGATWTRRRPPRDAGDAGGAGGGCGAADASPPVTSC
ncbi:hypothetical protein SAMN05444336_101972 [Albimonas donghaensis]|uniref:Uncharacterized protein n=1 Tax=Albimonas donghaensis TaxID=356660 RepID=A0A1H2TET5_9RHOB|nr:hypothetical protein SAMN05444336_101972 [Albimonas donghaensis]